MEIQSIFAWKSLPEAGFGKNIVIDAHRCSGSRIHLDHRSAGRSVIQDHSSDHRFKRLHLTRASVRRASGFVLTGYSETTSSWNSRLPGQMVSACPDSLAHHPECAFSSGNMGFSSTTLNPTSQSISVVWIVCRHLGLCNLLQNSVRKSSP